MEAAGIEPAAKAPSNEVWDATDPVAETRVLVHHGGLELRTGKDKSKARAADAKKPILRLKSLSLEGFKAVKRGRIALGDLTLLIGRNGSGKSSVVEALQWLQESMVSGLQAATEGRFKRYEELRNKRSTSTALHLEFSGSSEEPVHYTLRVAKAAGKYVRPIVVDEGLRTRRRAPQWPIWTTKGQKGPAVRNISEANPERDGDRLALSTAPRSGGAVQNVVDFLRRMVVLRLSPTSMVHTVSLEPRARGAVLDEEGRGLAAMLANMSTSQLKRVQQNVARVIRGIEDVKVVETDKARGYFAATERMLSRGGRKTHDIPAWMLSEGTRRMTAMFALLAYRPQPSMILIEEIENGLDPWTLEYVFEELRAAAARGIQILLTTHSPFLLDHVRPEQVVHVRRTDGDSSYTPITGYGDVTRYGGVVAPGAMYLAGYYAPQSDESAEETEE
jgi:predicted ATPase